MNKLITAANKTPSILQESYLPSLDGLRAISILFVIISHCLVHIVGTENVLVKIFGSGHLGVIFFFVISGFLITTLLVKETNKTGTISLKKFYIRRFLRIFPVAYLYLLVVLFLKFIFHINFSVWDLLPAVLYIGNLYIASGRVGEFTGHYWSLGVEEQFYLLFPLIQKISKKYYAIVLLICIVADLALKYFLFATQTQYILWGFIDNIDAILIGCFVSILLFNNAIAIEVLLKYKIPLHIAAAALIVSCHFVVPEFLKNTAIAVAFALVLVINLQPARDIIYKFLNWKLMVKIGVLSYSLYIWQQLFVFAHLEFRIKGVNILGFPFGLIYLPIVAFLSYNYFEKYFLNLKNRFKVVGKKTMIEV